MPATPRRTLPLIALAAACGGEPVYPDGLEPIEENTAPWPAFGVEEVEVVAAAGDDYDQVHARGYLRATPAEIWPALEVEEILVNRRSVVAWEATWGSEPDYDVSCTIHHVVEDILTVEFDIAWRQGAVEGSVDEPTLVIARYQKTDGTPFIPLIEGSILIRASEEEGISEIELIEHLDAAQDATEDIAQSAADRYEEIRAWVHGEPLPEYEIER